MSAKRRPRVSLVNVLLTAGLCLGLGACSPVESSFPSRDITLIVPFSPGGGYDSLARGLAPHLSKYLPGDVSVIVRNRTGAAGQVAMTDLFHARADGYTIALSNIPGLMVGKVIQKESTYDLTQVTWLGRITVISNGLAVGADSPYRSIEDFKSSGPLFFAGADAADTTTALVAFSQMGIDTVPLPHEGSGDAALSVMRGDTDITYFSLSRMVEFVRSNDLRVLVQFAEERLSYFPDVPTIGELGYPALADIAVQQRMIAAPPNLPPEIGAILEEALRKAVHDPEFQAFAEKLHQPVNWRSATGAQTIVDTGAQFIEKHAEMLRAKFKVQ